MLIFVIQQSMGEKVEAKKVKMKKREKIEKSKVEKRDRGRASVEKELGEQEGEEEETIEEIVKQEEKENLKVVNRIRNKFVDEDLVAFKNNFYLVTPGKPRMSYCPVCVCLDLWVFHVILVRCTTTH